MLEHSEFVLVNHDQPVIVMHEIILFVIAVHRVHVITEHHHVFVIHDPGVIAINEIIPFVLVELHARAINVRLIVVVIVELYVLVIYELVRMGVHVGTELKDVIATIVLIILASGMVHVIV